MLYASPNNFIILTDEDHDDEHPEFRSSEPSPRVAQHRPVPNNFFKLRELNINCQSLVNKKAEFHALLDLHNPDIVIGTEFWLTPNHLDSEFFPHSLGYTPLREDRVQVLWVVVSSF